MKLTITNQNVLVIQIMSSLKYIMVKIPWFDTWPFWPALWRQVLWPTNMSISEAYIQHLWGTINIISWHSVHSSSIASWKPSRQNGDWRLFIVRSYHTPLTQRVDRALGAMVEPCCMKPPTGNQKLLPSEYWLMSRLQRPFRQGWGLYHS